MTAPCAASQRPLVSPQMQGVLKHSLSPLAEACRVAAQRRQELRERLQLDRYATPPPSDGDAPAASAPAPSRVREYAGGELRTTVTVAPISLYRRAATAPPAFSGPSCTRCI